VKDFDERLTPNGNIRVFGIDLMHFEEHRGDIHSVTPPSNPGYYDNMIDVFEQELLRQVALTRQSPYLGLNIQVSDAFGVGLDEGFTGWDFIAH